MGSEILNLEGLRSISRVRRGWPHSPILDVAYADMQYGKEFDLVPAPGVTRMLIGDRPGLCLAAPGLSSSIPLAAACVAVLPPDMGVTLSSSEGVPTFYIVALKADGELPCIVMGEVRQANVAPVCLEQTVVMRLCSAGLTSIELWRFPTRESRAEVAGPALILPIGEGELNIWPDIVSRFRFSHAGDFDMRVRASHLLTYGQSASLTSTPTGGSCIVMQFAD